jgi:hypothetical protein
MLKHSESRLEKEQKKEMDNRKFQICRILPLILLMLSCSGQLQNKPAFSTGKGSNSS